MRIVKETPISTDRTQHLTSIDGLRGIAAFGVLFYHCAGLLPHGYLAVDFFFGLSGYVLALTYEKHFAKGLGAREYMLLRVRRLYPLILFGALIGLLLSSLNPDVQQALALDPNGFWLGFLGQVFMIPLLAPPGLFLFNPPQWSLFFELVANLAHVLLFARLKNAVLAILLPIAASLLIAASMHGDQKIFNPGTASATFLIGFPRAIFGYFAGVLLFR